MKKRANPWFWQWIKSGFIVSFIINLWWNGHQRNVMAFTVFPYRQTALLIQISERVINSRQPPTPDKYWLISQQETSQTVQKVDPESTQNSTHYQQAKVQTNIDRLGERQRVLIQYRTRQFLCCFE